MGNEFRRFKGTTPKIYGGNIEVQSEEGKGTRFIVTWPKIINISKHMEVRI